MNAEGQIAKQNNAEIILANLRCIFKLKVQIF